MGQRFKFGKQQLEVGLELGAGHLPVDLAPGGELKDEHQQPIEQQNRKLVSAFARVSQIGDLPQLFKQTGQFATQHRQLSSHRFLTRLLFLGYGGVGRAGIGQCRRCPEGEPFDYLPGSKRVLLLFFLRRCALMVSRRGRRDSLLIASVSLTRTQRTVDGDNPHAVA